MKRFLLLICAIAVISCTTDHENLAPFVNDKITVRAPICFKKGKFIPASDQEEFIKRCGAENLDKICCQYTNHEEECCLHKFVGPPDDTYYTRDDTFYNVSTIEQFDVVINQDTSRVITIE
jgi:hypothetical protein